jgi:DNA repair protein RecO (recombination protein O)
MRTYMVRGVRKRKSKTPMNLFQPLSLLEMVVYEKGGRDIQNVKEIKPYVHFKSIPFNIKKTSIALFLNELVLKSIGEEEQNQAVFNFIYQSVIFLDEADEAYENLHLWFMTHFARFLGFKSSSNFDAQSHKTFDLQEGRFTHLVLPDSISIQPPLSVAFSKLQQDEYYGNHISLNRTIRLQLLLKLQQYYQFHLPGFSDLKSLSILTEVMD